MEEIMEETLDIQTPTNKIYSKRAILVGTFLGGPLAAGYLIAENFKAFNDPDKAKKTWIYAIIATIVVFGIIFLIPDIPALTIPAIYLGITSYVVQHFQGKNISTHINLGGQLHSGWRTIAVGMIGLAIMVILSFVLVLLDLLR